MVCQLEQRKGTQMTDPSASGNGRDQMLARLVAHVRANGLPADCSLRRLALELGTSHRMLAYYFGSREGLLTTVLTALRTEERETLTCTAESWGLRDAALAMWSYYTDPVQASEHQVFFYVFSLALQQPESYREFLASLNTWSVLTAELGVSQGIEPERAEQTAQLIVSAVRGLLMDRLISTDPDRVDAAFALLLDAVLPEEPTVAHPVRAVSRAATSRARTR
jgi:AcrR family transcriptional regulator